jgi:hypothetical protein
MKKKSKWHKKILSTDKGNFQSKLSRTIRKKRMAETRKKKSELNAFSNNQLKLKTRTGLLL